MKPLAGFFTLDSIIYFHTVSQFYFYVKYFQQASFFLAFLLHFFG